MPLSTDEYSDEVDCDITYMYACHILFGRPWQFDHDVKQRGRKNSYKLEKEGAKYIFVLISERTPTKISKMKAVNNFIDIITQCWVSREYKWMMRYDKHAEDRRF